MSLLPMLFSNWWENLDHPHHLRNQHFGRVLNANEFLHDSISPLDSSLMVLRAPRTRFHHFHPYEKAIARKSEGLSVVHADKDKFQVNLDVQQFTPEEINVKVVGRNVVIDGKHEEKQDEHGFVSRQFTRKYLVPEQCEIDELKSHLSSDGVLTITAPRKKALENANERAIPIIHTGQPALKDAEASSSQTKDSNTPKTPVTRSQEKSSKTVKAA
ncbi:protein lethal(2)essential for life-like [Fopius arisanus]|uniref:Protein lethal(2)essential for life-like n=1 Tax=Fopius arisanus TaxID=64838 RepID=A0A9R1T0L3_9HYME|nr:PREDICTED: protein lethal(2)essential for life-like [Fopius arisanus]